MKNSEKKIAEESPKGASDASGEHPAAMGADRITHARSLALPAK